MRRLILSLASRIGISHREVESWSFEEIREWLVILAPKKPGAAPLTQTPEQLEGGLFAAFGKQRPN
jgi:hypothetical protein